ncbi:glycosyltransferase involved in cell wall biosynthesis [Azospirillum sp. OGB3]|uniref:glycosyltransferase family 4 protein n=1 Tax=Azospirillum sp. OGB3 TaxID=2587012 RepID=UPI00160560E8|nr:glycosyltransferase family 4 protein [Azospirillum sp. OGB3]MBB3267926.1 glycosyltransferase involved in cell wall biosynthesis [Azospirillum sp. OGB3]
MNIVFIHQNMPGQYKHLAARLAADPANRVIFITKRTDRDIPNVRRLSYQPSRKARENAHPYLVSTENAVLHGQAAARLLMGLREEGFRPDVIVGHPGWGETLFVKDVFPNTPYLNYCEFFYRAQGLDVGFDPSVPVNVDTVLRLRMRSTPLLLALEACDRGIAPTEWQRDSHPAPFHPKIEVIHDGVDTAQLLPDPGIRVTLADGTVLTRQDEVLTYAVRNLEPYRGFPSFMRALPRILEARPRAHVLIAGGDEVSYGSAPPGGKSWRETMLAEMPLDPARVHFLGHLPYDQYLSVLRLSRAHIYLTYPFVLSWSMVESMALGCVVIGSDTAPVREVIRHGENGLLADFFSPDDIAAKAIAVLQDPGAFAPLARAARETAVERFELSRCLDRQIALIRAMA